jgi:hypothetical protein
MFRRRNSLQSRRFRLAGAEEFSVTAFGNASWSCAPRSFLRVPARADKSDADRGAAAPDDLARARRAPGDESDIQPASNLHGCINGYLRAARSNILKVAFAIGRPAIQRDPRRLMAPPANLLALHLELRPCLVLHADRLTGNRLSLAHRDASLCLCRADFPSRADRRSPRSIRFYRRDEIGDPQKSLTDPPDTIGAQE